MKVYSLIDSFGDILTSTDKGLLEEIMCDIFMEEFQEECQAAVDEHFINMEGQDKYTPAVLKENWDRLVKWYIQEWRIQETILI